MRARPESARWSRKDMRVSRRGEERYDRRMLSPTSRLAEAPVDSRTSSRLAWFGWVAVLAVAMLLSGATPLAAALASAFLGLPLLRSMWLRRRWLHSTSNPEARDRLSGTSWLLASGVVLLCGAAPLSIVRAPWAEVGADLLLLLAAAAFGVGLERRVLRSRRRMREAR